MTNITNNEIVTSFTGLQSIYIYTQIQGPPNNVTVLWTSSTGISNSKMEKWPPRPLAALTHCGTGGRGMGGHRWQGVCGCSVVSLVQQGGKHRLNLIHTLRSSVSGFLTTGLGGSSDSAAPRQQRVLWHCALRPAQTQEPFSVHEALGPASSDGAGKDLS